MDFTHRSNWEAAVFDFHGQGSWGVAKAGSMHDFGGVSTHWKGSQLRVLFTSGRWTGGVGRICESCWPLLQRQSGSELHTDEKRTSDLWRLQNVTGMKKQILSCTKRYIFTKQLAKVIKKCINPDNIIITACIMAQLWFFSVILLDLCAIQSNSKNSVMLSKKHEEMYFFPFDTYIYKLFLYYYLCKNEGNKGWKSCRILKKHLSGGFQRKTVERLRAGDSSMRVWVISSHRLGKPLFVCKSRRAVLIYLLRGGSEESARSLSGGSLKTCRKHLDMNKHL